jgi:DNA-binding beta-propeller fold protein YncE
LETSHFFFGVPMSLRRVGGLAAMALATVLWSSCGQVYRPVVIPTSLTPPNPGNFHAVFTVAANVPFNPGTTLQIDVSGDTDIGADTVGVNPTHAGLLPNFSRVFVASAGSLFPGDTDLVTSFTPAVDSSVATGLGGQLVYNMPTGSQPVFVNTTQISAVYTANYGSNSVSILSPSSNVVTLTSPAGTQPVALAETYDGQNLYVVDQGGNSVTDLSPIDLTVLATIPVGITPTWAVVRPDSQRIYVVTQGDGQLYTISTVSNSVLSNESVGGPGANFVLYDRSLNRLYVTNPVAGAVYVFDSTSDPPAPLATLNIAAPPVTAAGSICGTSTCSYSSVAPESVAALPDGSRFYVASYVTGTATSATGPTCPDPNVISAGCVIPQVTVFDAATFTVKSTIFPLIPSNGSSTPPFAVAAQSYCAPVTPYAPSAARFRMSAAAAADSSRAYASVCDGGWIAIVDTTTSSITTGTTNTPDTLVTDLDTPFSAAPAGPSGEPPFQFPVFLLTGQ